MFTPFAINFLLKDFLFTNLLPFWCSSGFMEFHGSLRNAGCRVLSVLSSSLCVLKKGRGWTQLLKKRTVKLLLHFSHSGGCMLKIDTAHIPDLQYLRSLENKLVLCFLSSWGRQLRLVILRSLHSPYKRTTLLQINVWPF